MSPWDLIIVGIMVALYACVFVSLAGIFVLDVVILVEFLGIAKLRKSWQFPAVLISCSTIAGLLWTPASEYYVLLNSAIFAFAVLPIIKLAYCWHENAMPENRIYEIGLRLSFPSCCLLCVFFVWVFLGWLRNTAH